MKWIKLSLFGIAILFLILLILPLSIGVILYKSADFKTPLDSVCLSKYIVHEQNDSSKFIGDNFIHLNKYGLWEVFVSGNPIDRGAKYGLLTKPLLEYQELVFVKTINELVPSDIYLNFLHKLTVIFNRNMANYIPEEYRKEIYAISKSCSHKFDFWGSPYERQLNYHAAHDIGHAMQEYMLVGCSSFAVWNDKSSDGSLLIGRNFDFYINDDFAKNKIILFMQPQTGYKYVSVSWPGMIGVVSGMNEKGLSITINASKGSIPTSSAMPISLLAREILQYASNIEQAYNIAKKHKTFVSESLLIGSAQDHRAVIIEKSPMETALFKGENEIVCTNHFQSNKFCNVAENIENKKKSDTQYRYNRLRELIDSMVMISPTKAVDILRDKKGLKNKDLGMTNPKALDQSIAHHSVIFQPEHLKMWVSTSPWQDGVYICYDLNKIFKNPQILVNLSSYDRIDADSVFIKKELPKIKMFRQRLKEIKQCIKNKSELSDLFINEFISSNPNYYETYNIIGDYYEAMNNIENALKYWRLSLNYEVVSQNEIDKIVGKLKKYDNKQGYGKK